MNIPAIRTAFKALRDPSLLLPHYTVPTFADLPIPLSKAFQGNNDEKPIDIRAIVLDKDNCFATPDTNAVHPSCRQKFDELVEHYSPENILIVSNSSGLSSKDPNGSLASALRKETGLEVLHHQISKPSCQSEVLAHFAKRGVTSPSQIVCIGDRLFTDVIMANLMGSRAIWIQRGVRQDAGVVTRFEYGVEGYLRRRGWAAPRVAR